MEGLCFLPRFLGADKSEACAILSILTSKPLSDRQPDLLADSPTWPSNTTCLTSPRAAQLAKLVRKLVMQWHNFI